MMDCWSNTNICYHCLDGTLSDHFPGCLKGVGMVCHYRTLEVIVEVSEYLISYLLLFGQCGAVYQCHDSNVDLFQTKSLTSCIKYTCVWYVPFWPLYRIEGYHFHSTYLHFSLKIPPPPQPNRWAVCGCDETSGRLSSFRVPLGGSPWQSNVCVFIW